MDNLIFNRNWIKLSNNVNKIYHDHETILHYRQVNGDLKRINEAITKTLAFTIIGMTPDVIPNTFFIKHIVKTKGQLRHNMSGRLSDIVILWTFKKNAKCLVEHSRKITIFIIFVEYSHSFMNMDEYYNNENRTKSRLLRV